MLSVLHTKSKAKRKKKTNEQGADSVGFAPSSSLSYIVKNLTSARAAEFVNILLTIRNMY